MNDICTSVEHSKKLLELGIDVKTADMWWAERYEGRVTENGQYIVAEEPYYYPSLIKPSDNNYSQDTIKDIPAWTLTALEQLMPFHIIENNERYGFGQWKGLNARGETYCFQYKSNTEECLYETIHWNNPLNAAFEMVCWLKENGKI